MKNKQTPIILQKMREEQDELANVHYFNEKCKGYTFQCRDTLKKYKLKFYKDISAMAVRLESMSDYRTIAFRVWHNTSVRDIQPKVDAMIERLTFDYLMEF